MWEIAFISTDVKKSYSNKALCGGCCCSCLHLLPTHTPESNWCSQRTCQKALWEMEENTRWSRSRRDGSMRWEFTAKLNQFRSENWMMILHVTLNASSRYNRSRTYPEVYFPLNSDCLCFEGMSCCRSSFPSWRRQRAALTSSRAATRPLVCSDVLTTACPLKSGLRLQRLSSSLVTSVSSLRRAVSSWATQHQCYIQVVSSKRSELYWWWLIIFSLVFCI